MEARVVRDMFSSIAERYDVTNSVLSLGIHHSWRKALLSFAPAGRDLAVLDLCTGTGDLIPLLNERFGENVTGVDFCLPMLERARRKEDLRKPRLVQGDAQQLPFSADCFDVVTVAFGVRNFSELETGLREILRVLKPGGKLLVLEFGQPKNLLVRKVFDFYSRHFMPLIGGLLTGNRQAYKYLPETSRAFPCREEFMSILRKLNFTNTSFKMLSFGIAYAYSAQK